MTIKKSLALLLPLAIIVTGMAISGCASPAATPQTTAGSSDTQSTGTVLTVSGNVANALQLSLSDLASYRVNQSAGMGGFPGGSNVTGNASFPGGERNMTYGGGPGGANASFPGGANNMTGSGPNGRNMSYQGGYPNGGYGGERGNSSYAGRGSGNAREISAFSINSLLDAAAPNSSATNVTFIGANGTNTSVSLSDIRANQNAMILSMNGNLRVVIPGEASSSQISDLTTIKVK